MSADVGGNAIYGPHVSPVQVQTMNDRIRDLRTLWLQCSAAGAPQSAMDAFSRGIDNLVQRTARVHNGTETFERWLSDADSYLRVWRTEPAEQRASSTLSILSSTVATSAADLHEGTAKIVGAAQQGWVWGLLFLGLGAALYLKVAR